MCSFGYQSELANGFPLTNSLSVQRASDGGGPPVAVLGESALGMLSEGIYDGGVSRGGGSLLESIQEAPSVKLAKDAKSEWARGKASRECLGSVDSITCSVRCSFGTPSSLPPIPSLGTITAVSDAAVKKVPKKKKEGSVSGGVEAGVVSNPLFETM